MKKIINLLLPLIFVIAIISCGDDNGTTDPILDEKGALQILSSPEGAKIYIDSVATGDVTPYTYGSKDVKEYKVKLTLDNYQDTTFTVSVLKGQTTTVNIKLTPEYVVYGPVKIWESLDPSTNHPSGLSLKLGKAYSIAQSKDSSAFNDIYYNSDGFLVVSADNRNNNNKMTRETFFKVGSSTNLSDGVAASVKDQTWGKSIDANERNYIFLYDADGHYSKLIILEKNDPSSLTSKDGNLVVKWIYNKAENNTSF
ncbi:MAG: hypothetical protein CR986_06140 [Ignavibacteriae bacterium]|nr:MAG: hypothetical protein CR986_06140 [Ignavibacteriota bacterium]